MNGLLTAVVPLWLQIHTGRVITVAKAVRYLKPSQSEFQKLFSTLCGSRSDWQVWSDFITMSATAISNTFDREGPTHDERKRQYMELSHGYTKDELDILARLLSTIVMALEDDPRQDFLGEVFQGLGLNSHWKGQFFTPYHICEFMAEITLGNAETEIRKKGWIGINDPACGAGALLIAARNAMVKRGLPGSGVLFAAQDIDRTAALMCYIQLALLGCAGYVIIGDSLLHPPTGHALCPNPNPELDVWYLPMFYEQTWHYRRIWHSLNAVLRSERPHAAPKELPQPRQAVVMPAQPLPAPAFSETAAGQLMLF